MSGAGDRGRTGTRSLPGDFKSPASAYSATPAKKMEAPPRFELGVKDLQSSALPLGYGAVPIYIITAASKKQEQNWPPLFFTCRLPAAGRRRGRKIFA